MSQNQAPNLRLMVFACLFTALIVIGGYISFPLPFSPVPIVLADFFAMLAGLFLGAAWGIASVGLFLFLGVLGLPVFSGGKAGLPVLFGPTGGFLLGYLVAVLVIGFISGKGKSSFLKDLIALIAGNIVLYGMGVPWLKFAVKTSCEKALAMGLLPFIPGLIIKIIVALALIKTLRPLLNSMTNPSLKA